jgi:hypothetical protein
MNASDVMIRNIASVRRDAADRGRHSVDARLSHQRSALLAIAFAYNVVP